MTIIMRPDLQKGSFPDIWHTGKQNAVTVELF